MLFIKNPISKVAYYLLTFACCWISHAQASDSLLSWREGKAKSAILSFVEKTTNPESPDFVVPSRRIAVFDNDGTLWAE